MSSKQKYPPKDKDVMGKIKSFIEEGKLFDTRHSTDRKSLRKVEKYEAEYVVLNGYHEKRKDEFKEEYGSWNYAIRGKTLDGKELRVAIYFDDGVHIATVITKP